MSSNTLVSDGSDLGNDSNVKSINTGIIPLTTKLFGYIRAVSPNNDTNDIYDIEYDRLIKRINRITPTVYLKQLRKMLVDIRKYITFSHIDFKIKRVKLDILNKLIKRIDTKIAKKGDISSKEVVIIIDDYLKDLYNYIDFKVVGGSRCKTRRRSTKCSRKHNRTRSSLF